MTNSRPILRYFDDGKGRAELPRLIFIYGSVPFEDKTISFQEYARMREIGELPFEQFPTLEVDNNIIGQSCAILCTLDETAQLWTTPSTFFYIPEPNGPFRPPEKLLKPYPKLNTLHSIISQTPSIADWLQTHPY